MSSNKATFIGRVVEVGKTETLGKNPAKPFYKRTIIVDDAEEGAKYPNPVPFETSGDKCKFFDGIEVGDVVTIEFYPNGRAWNDPKTGKTRYFGSNHVTFIKQGAVEDAGGDAGSAEAGGDAEAADVDDIPF